MIAIARFARATAQETARATSFVALMVWYFGPPVIRRLLRLRPAGPSTAVRLRRVIEGMGISFVKLGQFLAMRFDILPPEICHELDRLFEDASVLRIATVRRRVEAELGRPIAELFASFEAKPLAAASIAQVHRAVTRDGQEVVVKVQRPGIPEVFAADMRILRRVAWLADLFHVLGKIELRGLVASFAEFTAREMNFLAEARTADLVRESPGTETRIPVIRWDLTTPRILTMEFLRGDSLLALCQQAEIAGPESLAEKLPGVSLEDAIVRLARTCLYQMFVTGLFHGDPHPGNILIMHDGTPVLLDFGIFGRLTPRTRTQLAQFYEALAVGNIAEAFRCYQYISDATEDTDVVRYRSEVIESLERWYELTASGYGTLQERHPLKFVTEIIGIMRRHAVRMPAEQLLFWRSLTTLASLALRLPVPFDLIAVMRQFFGELRPTFAQRVLELARLDTVTTVRDLVLDVPRKTRGFLAQVAGGSAALQVRTRRSPAARRLSRATSRTAAVVAVAMSAAVLLAALVGSYP